MKSMISYFEHFRIVDNFELSTNSHLFDSFYPQYGRQNIENQRKMTQPQDGTKTNKTKLQSDALNAANAINNVDKQIRSDQQKPPDDDQIARSTDDVDQSPISYGGNDITTFTSGGTSTFNPKLCIDERRASLPYPNGGPLNGGNSLISRDTLILLPEGGKNSAANGDKYPVSRNSDNENSDTDVSEPTIFKYSIIHTIETLTHF